MSIIQSSIVGKNKWAQGMRLGKGRLLVVSMPGVAKPYLVRSTGNLSYAELPAPLPDDCKATRRVWQIEAQDTSGSNGNYLVSSVRRPWCTALAGVQYFFNHRVDSALAFAN